MLNIVLHRRVGQLTQLGLHFMHYYPPSIIKYCLEYHIDLMGKEKAKEISITFILHSYHHHHHHILDTKDNSVRINHLKTGDTTMSG